LKAIAKAAKVKRLTTTPFHPQANGQVERTNKTIAQMHKQPKLELDVMLRIEHYEIDFGKQNAA
jgi:hypothetical protein